MTSESGSVSNGPSVLGKSSKVYLLFDFGTETDPGFGTVSSIKTPQVPDGVMERFLQLDSWMKEEKQLVIRWPHKHKSSWNVTEYSNKGEALMDCVFRSGTIILMSDDKDALMKKKTDFLKARKISAAAKADALAAATVTAAAKTDETATTAVTTAAVSNATAAATATADVLPVVAAPPISRRAIHQQFPERANDLLVLTSQNNVDDNRNRSTYPSSLSSTTSATTRKHRLLEQENSQLRAKVIKLECELSAARSTLDTYDDEKLELLEENKKLRSEIPLELAKVLKENIQQLSDLYARESNSPTALQRGLLTPRSCTPSSTSGKARRMAPLDEHVEIDFNSLRDAIAIGKEANNKKNINAMVGKIIDALMDSEQQAGYSLTGAACRSKPKDQQIPKEKFPEEFAAAIYTFVSGRFKEWYKVDLLKTQISGAITDKLICSHSSKLKKEKAAKNKRAEAAKLKAAENEIVEMGALANDPGKVDGDDASVTSAGGTD